MRPWDREFDSCHRRFFFPTASELVLGLMHRYRIGVLSANVKQPKHKYYHLPVSDADIKNMWSYPTCSEVYKA